MTFRLIALPLCSVLLILAAMTDTQAGEKHKGEIDVLAWSWGTNNTSNNKGNKAIQQPIVGVNSDRMGGGGGAKGACPQDMVAKGNSCVERERRDTIRNIPGGGRMGGGGGGRVNDPPRGGQGPTDLPGRR